MPYVRRDAKGAIVAIGAEPSEGFEESLPGDSVELVKFLQEQRCTTSLDDTDQDFVRVLEDVVELLIDKGVILFTELPQSAQDKIMRRQRLRSELNGRLNLIGDD